MTFCFLGCLQANLFKQFQIWNKTIQGFSWLLQSWVGGSLKNQFKLSCFVNFHLFAGFWWLSSQPLTPSRFIWKPDLTGFRIDLGLLTNESPLQARLVQNSSLEIYFSPGREGSGCILRRRTDFKSFRFNSLFEFLQIFLSLI